MDLEHERRLTDVEAKADRCEGRIKKSVTWLLVLVPSYAAARLPMVPDCGTQNRGGSE